MPSFTINNQTSSTITVNMESLECILISATELSLSPNTCSDFLTVSLGQHDECIAGSFNINVTATNGNAILPMVLDQYQQLFSGASQWVYFDRESGPTMYMMLVGNEIQIVDAFCTSPNPQPSEWNAARLLTQSEYNDLEGLLSGVNNRAFTYRVYDERTATYNCLAWVMGITKCLMPNPMTSSITIYQLTAYLNGMASPVDIDDPTANIMVWGSGNLVDHVIAYRTLPTGNTWCSKLGFILNNNSAVGLLISHRKDDNDGQPISTKPYGGTIAAFACPIWPTPPAE